MEGVCFKNQMIMCQRYLYILFQTSVLIMAYFDVKTIWS